MAEQPGTLQPKWSHDLQYCARRAVGEARSGQSVGHVQLNHLYDFPDSSNYFCGKQVLNSFFFFKS